jgi:hypothetical protein
MPIDLDTKDYECPCCNITLHYNPLSKPKLVALQTLALEAPFIGRPAEVKQLLNSLLRVDAWTKNLQEELKRQPCAGYIGDILHRLYCLPVVTSVALEFEKYGKQKVTPALVCVCNTPYDPRNVSYECKSCQRIFHVKCKEPVVTGKSSKNAKDSQNSEYAKDAPKGWSTKGNHWILQTSGSCEGERTLIQ